MTAPTRHISGSPTAGAVVAVTGSSAFAGGLMFVACTFTGYALALVIWWRGKR